MLSQQDNEFLDAVKNYVAKRPQVAAYVQSSVADGIAQALEKEKQLSIDLETMLIMATATPRTKHFKQQIAIKLEQIKGRLRFNYDSVINDLKGQ